MSSTTPIAIVDVLNSLLDAERGSIFRLMGPGSAYLADAAAEVRQVVEHMVTAEQRRAAELARLIESLTGSVPPATVTNGRGEQYLDQLSLKFLLPKLVEEKRLHLRRYENAIRAVKPMANIPPSVQALLSGEVAELRAELVALEAAAAEVAKQLSPLQ